MKFWLSVNGLTTIEHCPFVREGGRSILGTFELRKLLKIDIFISLCDNSAHKRADKQEM